MDLTVTDLLLYSFPGVLENNDIFRNALTGKLRKFGLNKSSFPGIGQSSLLSRQKSEYYLSKLLKAIIIFLIHG